MSRRVFVTGMGIISPIGNDLQENLQSLLDCRPGIGPIRYIDTILKSEIPVGQIVLDHERLFSMAGLSPEKGYSRNTLLGMIAAREAWMSARAGEAMNIVTGLVSATTVGGMDQCELYYQDFLTNDSRNEYIESYDCADSTERIAVSLGITGIATTISTACSSAANAILFGARLIKAGLLDRVLAGGTESLTKFHLNGFNALKILDKSPSRPFDATRAGINLGEGAAYLVLESEEALSMTGNSTVCELIGYGNACEAFHQTASSPDGIGAYLAMEKALVMSGIEPAQIDYINAHGTGTDNNDLAEGKAIEKLFGGRIPYVSSTKPFTGHMTSAAGSAEAIFAILCLQNKVIWPNLNFTQPMPELSFRPVEKLVTGIPVNIVMTNSFGFGGNDTALVFRKLGEWTS
jgi:3-oxoacyl-[acyl-carrier-protein] synthase-1